MARAVLLAIVFIIFVYIKTLYLYTLDKGIYIYNGVFQFNINTHNFSIFILILACIIITINAFYPRKIINETGTDNVIFNESNSENLSLESLNEAKKAEIKELDIDIFIGKDSEQYKIKEYVLIITFVVTGAIFLMSTSDLISIFLSIELQSYGLYLLCTIYRDSELSTKAGITYFLLGALASCILLLGLSILYINSGNTSMENIYILSDILSNYNPLLNSLNNSLYDYNYINISLAVLSAGFMFKVSASPFHF
jgi:NADH-ubiquinone oxidoreductase chain 2